MIGNKTQLKKLLVMLEDVIDNMDCSHTEEIFGDFTEALEKWDDKAFQHRSRASYVEDFTRSLIELQRSIYMVMISTAPPNRWDLSFEVQIKSLMSELRKKELASEHLAEELEPALSQPA